VKRSSSIIVLMSLALLAGHAQAAAAPGATGKIGVVNTNALLGQSPQVIAARQALETEFLPEDKAIQALATNLRTREEAFQKDAATMSAAARSTAERALSDGYVDLQARQKKLEDNLKARSAEEDEKLQRVVLEEVQKYARSNGFDLVLSAGVLYANAALDITAPVLEALKARAANPAAAAPATP
jgi:outer membrane protein